MKFSTGDTVTWTSQAGGVSKSKSGVVVAVVPAKTLPSKADFPGLYRGVGIGSSRDHESYVVRVKTGLSATRDYWPRAAALSLAPSAASDTLAHQVKAILDSGLSDADKLSEIGKLVL